MIKNIGKNLNVDWRIRLELDNKYALHTVHEQTNLLFEAKRTLIIVY